MPLLKDVTPEQYNQIEEIINRYADKAKEIADSHTYSSFTWYKLQRMYTKEILQVITPVPNS